ncbi:RING/U-box superfamily protein [Artemisia annua]|uniref:RING/U-box superfamily protein n=1 Tax=Artemisia annua TaxID=35608 RepID=A0A2U1NXH1_ARTAN|nr:RING/U-box superfamily protein [Artemisia annua]
MGVSALGLKHKTQTSKVPLLMERTESEHVIDITNSNEASSSSSSLPRPVTGSNLRQNEDPPTNSVSATNGTNARNLSFSRRGNGNGRRRSPLNSGYWISFELFITVSQIIAAVVVLSVSRHENPHAPLFTWVIGYASGCVVTLPLLFWRFHNRNASNQEQSQGRQSSTAGSLSAIANSFSSSSNGRTSEGDTRNAVGATSTRRFSIGSLSARAKVFVEYLKMGLDCFFAVWFVVGNVWIFGGHSSSSDAPNLYRLCIVFLTFSCIGYAMPFILCTTICCCLPCIISVLGFREDLPQNRGATTESINCLPTYKFKKNKHTKDKETNSSACEGGVVAAGTEKERVISGEDAVCCICLAKYANDDELRELPCSHFFHTDCVDKWLKINATCPLCKIEVGETILSSLTEATANLRRSAMY